jgi:hypothetical protein
MPTTDAQWIWFFFYTGGALAGWLALILHIHNAIKGADRDD